jgi:hypothetical protein
MIQSITWWMDMFDNNSTILSDVNLNETCDSITPLALCIYYNKFTHVNQLIDLGCDIKGKDDMAFCMAVLKNNINMAKKMLDMGADVNAIPNRTLLDFLGKIDSKYIRIKYWHDCIFLGKNNCDPLLYVGRHDNMLLFFSLPNIYDNRNDCSMYELLSSRGISKIHHSGIHFLNFGWISPYYSKDFMVKEILEHLENSGSHMVDNIIVFFPILLHFNEPVAINLIMNQINQLNFDDIHNIKHNISYRIIHNVFRMFKEDLKNDHFFYNLFEKDVGSLIWCLENNFCDTNLNLLGGLIPVLARHYVKDSYKIIRFVKEIYVNISEFIPQFIFQAMKHKDTDLLKTITENNDLDELLFELNQYIISMLDTKFI